MNQLHYLLFWFIHSSSCTGRLNPVMVVLPRIILHSSLSFLVNNSLGHFHMLFFGHLWLWSYSRGSVAHILCLFQTIIWPISIFWPDLIVLFIIGPDFLVPLPCLICRNLPGFFKGGLKFKHLIWIILLWHNLHNIFNQQSINRTSNLV